MTKYRFANVEGSKVFYREAGPVDAPKILHGFPTSSHMFRNPIPILAEQYHVVAPDLPGFGFTEKFRHTFESLAQTMDALVAVGCRERE